MALLATLAPPGAPGIISMNRGNIGVLTGIVSKNQDYISIPAITGGGGGEHSYTF